MRKVCADVCEWTGFGLLCLVNSRCVPEPLLSPTRDIPLGEILDTYPSEGTFQACELGAPLTWSPREFDCCGNPMRSFSTPSLYEPFAPFADTYAKLREDHTIRGVFSRPAERRPGQSARTALIFLHGWSERSLGLEMRFLLPALFREMPDLDVYLMEQPYHMHRRPPCTPYSGSFFFDTTPVGLIEAMRQAASDASQLVTTLRSEYDRVVVMGISLGGHALSYLATCDNRPDAFVLCQAGMTLPDMDYMGRLAPCLGKRITNDEQARAFHDPISLTRYRPAVPGEKIVTVHGAYDRLIPMESAHCLIRHFDARHRIFYRGSHLTLLAQSRSVVKVIARRLGLILGA